MLTEDQSQCAAQYVQPLVALVRLEVRLASGSAGRDDDLIGLHGARSARQGQKCFPVSSKRVRVDTRVAGFRAADQFVEWYAVGSRDGQQQLEVRPAVAGLEPRQRTDRDAGGRRQFGQARLALLTQRAQARSYQSEDALFGVHHDILPRTARMTAAVCHSSLPLWQFCLPLTRRRSMVWTR